MTAPEPIAEAFRALPAGAEDLDVLLDAEAAAKLRRHFELVLAKNEVMNLTRVTDPREAVAKLYLGSLALVPGLQQVGVFLDGFFAALDLGSGAGFPGIPLAVAYPDLSMVLLDARRKKVEFLEAAAGELGLTNVTAVHGRGAELPRLRPDLAGSFELVTARAVASAAATVEEAAGLLAPGGVLAVFKGPGLTEEEVAEGAAAAARHGLVFRAAVEPEVEGLSPRILVYSSWSARDEGLFPE